MSVKAKYIKPDRLRGLETGLNDMIASGRWARARDAIAVCLALHGMRCGEVTGARLVDLDVEDGLLDVETSKRGNNRTIELHATLVAAILAWRAGSANEWLLFTRTGRRIATSQLRRSWQAISLRLLGRSVKFHALRHTFAVRLYQAKPDILLVKQQLGHRSVRSTEVYAATLQSVPDTCLVRLDSVAPPLKLFCPAG